MDYRQLRSCAKHIFVFIHKPTPPTIKPGYPYTLNAPNAQIHPFAAEAEAAAAAVAFDKSLQPFGIRRALDCLPQRQ